MKIQKTNKKTTNKQKLQRVEHSWEQVKEKMKEWKHKHILSLACLSLCEIQSGRFTLSVLDVSSTQRCGRKWRVQSELINGVEQSCIKQKSADELTARVACYVRVCVLVVYICVPQHCSFRGFLLGYEWGVIIGKSILSDCYEYTN